ncbi:MAG: hypothetical protein ACYSO4_01135 [Planctomycetota bacterium]|jgi:hypothetical protein
MTWWEVEDMATRISDIAAALDEWSMSNFQMRVEQKTIDRITQKINRVLKHTAEPDKQTLLLSLAGRAEELRGLMAERLKRDIPG